MEEMAKMIDHMTDDEKEFALWYLLGDYERLLAEEVKEVPKTKDEFIKLRMEEKHLDAVTEIREILALDMWGGK